MDFAIWVTNECNMNCKYCYVVEKRGNRFFPEDNVLQLVNFINETSKKEKEVKISFFGGEPLLNFKLIQRIIEHIESSLSAEVKYYLTTNGLLLTKEIAEYLVEKKVYVSLSWDGCEVANDQNRVDKGGNGTYKRILNAYHLLKKAGLNNIRVRATFNSETVKYLEDSIADFHSKDMDMSVIFVPDYFDKNWSEKTLMELSDVLQACSDRDLRNISILQLLGLEKCVCGGGVSNFNIYIDGKVYPCSFATNEEQFCIGDIWNGLKEERISSLVQCYKTPIQECEGCDYEEYCLTHKCRYLNWALMSELNKPSPIVCQLENIKWCSDKKFI